MSHQQVTVVASACGVAGIFTADPALVPEARLLASISCSEMLTMCQAGCPKPAASAVELDQNEAGGSVKRLIPGRASRPGGHVWNV